MLVSESMAKARSCMVVLRLLFLSGTGSFWFTISGDTTTQYSKSADNYYAFLVTAGLASYTKEKGVGYSKSVQQDGRTSSLILF